MPKFQVSRSIQIQASPEQVFATVSDFETWTTWSPWLCAEPEATVSVSDNANSVGSLYNWDGNIVGAGEIEHKRLEPSMLIEEELRIIKPFKSKSRVVFELQPSGDGTEISWTMHGALPFFMFWMKGMMQTMIGMDYERGLKMLKEYIETGAVISTTKIHGVESIGPLAMIGRRGKSTMQEIGPNMDSMICEAKEKMRQQGLPTDGEMISVYHDFDMKSQVFDFSTGFVVPVSTVTSAINGLETWSIPTTKALKVEHVGRYDNLGNPWSAGNQYTRYKKLKQSRVGAFEIYKNSPEEVSDAELLTEIYMPLK